MAHRLSAIDCLSRGCANLRGNWKVVPMILVQLIGCGVLVFGGFLLIFFLAGATSLLTPDAFEDPARLQEGLQGLTQDWQALAIGLATFFILLTVVSLVYCWFQAGIVATLERGERQAPLARSTAPELYETFTLANFFGWASSYAWKLFWLFGWMLLLTSVALAVVAGGVVAAVLLVQNVSGVAAAVLGCVAVPPLIVSMLVLNVWFAIGQTLVVQERFPVLPASRMAFAILRRRFGAALVVACSFVVASLIATVIFVPLTQGMAIALGEGGLAALTVQLLLTLAQWLVSGMLSVAFFGTVVALTRTELDFERGAA